jgi:biopolymer transport protein ExbD
VRLLGRAAEEPGLNLTSMTDIVFLMLVFFMLATTFVDEERVLGIELPPASSSSDAPARELVIHVLEDGTVVVSGAPRTPAELEQHLLSVARGAPETPVTIRGHRRARHEAIVAVMDACGRAGLGNLSVGTTDGKRAPG